MTHERILRQLTKQHLVALQLAAGDDGGMYPGIQWDFAARKFRHLESLGLVRADHPHNPVHKTRAVSTSLGDDVLAASKETVK